MTCVWPIRPVRPPQKTGRSRKRAVMTGTIVSISAKDTNSKVGWRGGGSKLGWPQIAASVCGFGPRSRSTFVFRMDPLTNDGGP